MKLKKFLAGMVSILAISSALITVTPVSADDTSYDIEFSISADNSSISEDGSSVSVSFDLIKQDVEDIAGQATVKTNIMLSNDILSPPKNAVIGLGTVNGNKYNNKIEEVGHVNDITFTATEGATGTVELYFEITDVSYAPVDENGSAADAISFVDKAKPTTNVLVFTLEDGKIVSVNDEETPIITLPSDTVSETTTTTTITTTSQVSDTTVTTTPKASDTTVTTTPKASDTTVTTTPKASDTTVTTTPKVSDTTVTTTPKVSTTTVTTTSKVSTTAVTTTSKVSGTTTVTTTSKTNGATSTTTTKSNNSNSNNSNQNSDKGKGNSSPNTSDTGVLPIITLITACTAGILSCKKK